MGYAYPSDSSVPVYQNLLTPGTNPGYSPGVDDPMNHLCIVHYGYTAPQPGDPGYIDPNNPVEPTDPDDPNNPGSQTGQSNSGNGGNPAGQGNSGNPNGTREDTDTPGDAGGTENSGKLPDGY